MNNPEVREAIKNGDIEAMAKIINSISAKRKKLMRVEYSKETETFYVYIPKEVKVEVIRT